MGEEQGLKEWGVSCRIYHIKEFLLFVFLFHNQTITERDSFFYTHQALNNKIQADSCQVYGPAKAWGM
jgi:hypothetical protein